MSFGTYTKEDETYAKFKAEDAEEKEYQIDSFMEFLDEWNQGGDDQKEARRRTKIVNEIKSLLPEYFGYTFDYIKHTEEKKLQAWKKSVEEFNNGAR